MRNVREQGREGTGREGTGREGTGRARDLLWLLDARPTKLRQVWGGMGVTQRAQCAFEGDVGFEFG